MTQITGGSTRFMRRVQVAQYEPKEAEVTLTFAVSDGQEHTAIASQAAHEAMYLTECMLTGKIAPPAKEAVVQSAPVEHKPVSHKKTTKSEPVKTDPSAVEDLSAMEAEVNAEVNATAADPSAMEDTSIITGDGPVVQEIPDKTLVDACSAASKLTQNSDAIRAIISGYVAPPGRVANIPQDKRAEFLLKLQTVPKLTNG
jgi:hypothetical protein